VASLPMLEDMGMKVLDEQPYRNRAARLGADWITTSGDVELR